MKARLSSLRLRFEVSAEPLWIALRSDWLSLYLAAASSDGRSHSSVMCIAAFSTSFDDVIAASWGESRVGRVSFCYHISYATV